MTQETVNELILKMFRGAGYDHYELVEASNEQIIQAVLQLKNNTAFDEFLYYGRIEHGLFVFVCFCFVFLFSLPVKMTYNTFLEINLTYTRIQYQAVKTIFFVLALICFLLQCKHIYMLYKITFDSETYIINWITNQFLYI